MIREMAKEVDALQEKFTSKLKVCLEHIKNTVETKTGLTFEPNEYSDNDDEGMLDLCADTGEGYVYIRFTYDLYFWEIEDQTDDENYELMILECFNELLGIA